MKEVKEFRYLSYTLQRNGGQEAHIKERIKRAAVIMREVWGIGKRKFGKDLCRRLWLFDRNNMDGIELEWKYGEKGKE